MNVRLIAGKYGGRMLATPKNNRTHPMSERIRGSLFNILGEAVQGAVVLDAFAGSGSLGLEALSRGALRVVFTEKDRVAARVIEENAHALRIDDKKYDVIKTTLNNWLSSSTSQEFDLIFCDPPYHDLQFSTISKLFAYLKPNGLMVLSHSGRSEIPTETGVVVVDNRSYGNAVLTFYRKEVSGS
ncbi:MAG TPA: 16S rRNA (guanine(966)-N(2))-methyltransferase RsmD [Verrucomicrobiae bacterium]|nr:16S rRNA (guanine(966)-N(2))-methyltransferase RsmD [Verrucomicrobiae bacterium]